MQPTINFVLFVFIIKLTIIQSYRFDSSVDNLLYLTNTSTLYAISSSHLHQLQWSPTNQTLLLLHRRVRLHSSLDNTENGISVFLHEPTRNLLIICSRSLTGRCILHDANDIGRIYILDSNIETNYLGCFSGCYTFMSSAIIRSALIGNRYDKNGNIVNSKIEAKGDSTNYNIKYQFQSSDHTLITSLTFWHEKSSHMEYIYGFDHQQYTYYLLKSSRLARVCQAPIAMKMTYEEIPITNCHHRSSIITGAFHSFETFDHLYIIYENTICVYTMNEILRAFKASKIQCHMGHGYRLEHIVDSNEGRPKCQKTLEQHLLETNECTWQSPRVNTFMDGMVGAMGEELYRTMKANTTIRFAFARNHVVVIGTNHGHILKFIRHNKTMLHLVHQSYVYNGPLDNQYAADDVHESLIFAAGTELHRYYYNSCSLYDTCQSCVGSRRYDSKPCVWLNGKCSLSSDTLLNDRGCPPSIYKIEPMRASVNQARIELTMNGSFEGVHADYARVIVTFPSANQSQVFCRIETIHNKSLTCNLIVPKEPVEGKISIYVKASRELYPGDTDISGLIDYPEKFYTYIPKPVLLPDYGPAIGGTEILIRNLDLNLNASFRIFLGKTECEITEYEYPGGEVKCINRACANDKELLELNIQVNQRPWLIEKTFFQCQPNPIIFDWYPKKSILSGGVNLIVSGQNLDTVQKPKMKFVYASSTLEFISVCEAVTKSQMFCSSPIIDATAFTSPPYNLSVSFIMDNMKIIPNDDILVVMNDPVYYPFMNGIFEVNSTNIVRFEGSNLVTTHSMDQVDIRINNIYNACIPFNLTAVQLLCVLTPSAIKNIRFSSSNIEIRVGANLKFSMGKITFHSQRQQSMVSHVSLQFGSWAILILIVLFSAAVLSILFTLVTLTRRRFYQTSGKQNKQNKPPLCYRDIWCQLGKNKQIDRKNLTIHEKVGQGCFGDVYRGELKQKGNKPIDVAVKVLRNYDAVSINEFLFEANRMKDFSHANVLSLIGASWDPLRKALVLLPFMQNGDLRSYLINGKNRPTIRQLITWAIQIADGMEYLASIKFVHRDLATRNCMLDDQLICRISDFGLSRDIVDRDYYLVPTTKENNGKGTPVAPRRLPIRWLSPESIESSKYTVQSDVWSFGVLLWELMSRGKTPYPGIDNADIYTYIKHGYRLPKPTYCPLILYKSVMEVCWHADPAQRPSFTQLAHDIRHVLHKLELEQQQKHSSSGDEDDTTIVQRYPKDKKLKHLSAISLSSTSSIGGQYISTPHRQSENVQLLDDRREDTEDAYTITVNETITDAFSTTRLLPAYTETSFVEDA